jgi:hypothetical protein
MEQLQPVHAHLHLPPVHVRGRMPDAEDGHSLIWSRKRRVEKIKANRQTSSKQSNYFFEKKWPTNFQLPRPVRGHIAAAQNSTITKVFSRFSST